MKKGIYIASRASLPERPAAWRRLRDDGYPIISSWIDSIDKTVEFQSQSECDQLMSELWLKFVTEIQSSERLIVYVEADDFPLKGTLVEVGIALGSGIPIFIVAPGVTIEEGTYRPIGSWIKHPLVKVVDTMEDALIGICKNV